MTLASADRWVRVRRLFESAIELPSEQRLPFVSAACADDHETRADVLQLLEADESAIDLPVDRDCTREEPGIDGRMPEVLGFTLLRRLGAGGTSRVFEAICRENDARVAIKVMNAGANAQALQRFRQESRVLARLDHPSIVRLYESGHTQDGHVYLAMDFVDGDCIDRWCESASANLCTRVELALQVLEALGHAHAAGVVHRDIKPHNILLGANGEPKICDFGLAMVQDNLTLSRSGKLSGTPYYMSPEQAAGSRFGIDARTDIYSLGVTLYEALVLERPYSVESQGELLERILLGDTPDPRSVRQDLPDDLAAIVMTMMAKRREQRYDNMALVVEDLDRWLRGERPRARLRPRRRWLRPLLVSATALFVLSSALYLSLNNSSASAGAGKASPQDLDREAAFVLDPAREATYVGLPVLQAAAERLESQILPTTAPERALSLLLAAAELRLEDGTFRSALRTLGKMPQDQQDAAATPTQLLAMGDLRAKCAQLLGDHELELPTRRQVLQLACGALRENDPRRQFAAVEAARLEASFGRDQAAQAALDSTFGLRSMLRSRLFRNQRMSGGNGLDVRTVQAQLGELLLVEGTIDALHEGRRLLADAALAVRAEKGPKAWQSLFAQWRAVRAGRLVLQMEGQLYTAEQVGSQQLRAQNLSLVAAGLQDTAAAVPLLQLRFEAERIYAAEAAQEALALPQGLVALRRMEALLGTEHPETVELRACVVRMSLAACDAVDALELATTNKGLLERHAEAGAPVVLEAELYVAKARCALFGAEDSRARAMLESLAQQASAQEQTLAAGPELQRLRCMRVAEACAALLEE